MTSRPSLSPAEAAEVLRRARPIPTHRGASPVPLSSMSGTDFDGHVMSIEPAALSARMLLLFLSADCTGCEDLFEAAQAPASLGIEGDDSLMIVLRERDLADPSIRHRCGTAMTMVSSSTWTAYRVSGPPFFVLIDPGRSTVATEGVAWGAHSVVEALREAQNGRASIEVPRLDPTT